MELEPRRWSERIFGGCELGDQRRTRRLVDIGARLAAQGGGSVHRASAGDGAAHQGAYRWLRNDEVQPQAIGEGGYRATVALAAQYEELRAVEDTTSLAYAHKAAQELGDLGGPPTSRQRGFWVHTSLLLDARSGRTVGLIEQERWGRAHPARGQRHRRKERPYEAKESFKWQRASERIAERLGELMPRVIAVCDREADVYEYRGYQQTHRQRFIVRASGDRRVQGEPRRLFQALESAPVVGERTVEVEQRGGRFRRRQRQARVQLRAQTVPLRAPTSRPGLGALTVNAVLAQEMAPPAGTEPLHWLLLTSEPVASFEQVAAVVHRYAWRWRGEDYHKAWKAGVGVERSRLQQADNLERMAVGRSFVAVRLLQLREVLVEPRLFANPQAAHEAAERPCTAVLSGPEWPVLWVTQERSSPPPQPPPLRWAYQRIAQLGGWLDTKRTGRVGWETFWRGWFRLQERLEAYQCTRAFLEC